MIQTLRKSLAMVSRERRVGWLAVALLAGLVGALEGGAAGAVYLLVRILQNPVSVFEIPVLHYFQGLFTGASNSMIVLRFAALVGAYHVLKNILLFGTQYLRHRIEAETYAELSKTLLRGYLLLPYPFHFRRHSSELIRNTTASVGTVVHALEAFSGFVMEALVGCGILIVLFMATPSVTVVFGAALVIIVWGLLRLTRAMATRSGAQEHELAQTLYQTVQNALGGIKEIKALGREEYFFQAFAEVQRRRLDLGYLGVTLGVIPQLVIETAFVLAALVVVTLAAFHLPSGAEVLPALGLFAYAGFRMIPMSNRLVLRLNAFRASRPAVDALYDDFVLIHREVNPGWDEGDEGVAFRSELAIEDVSYTYPGAPRAAVAGVSFTLPAGGSLGIVGPTGAGKSTLVDLVVGLLSPTKGRILADGVELRGRTRGWRQRVGYIPQSIFLLDDTLQSNVAMGIPVEKIDGDAVLRALRMAQLEPLLATWPDGVHTRIGERGIRLSGGERQRVGIARALYHDPDLLIFDEATSALDTITETEVNRAMDALRGRKSMLVIAHRISTVRGCDRLIYLEEGRIAAVGSYDELFATHPRFRRMATVPGDLSVERVTSERAETG